MTEANQFLEFDFRSYHSDLLAKLTSNRSSAGPRLRFYISSVAAKAEIIFRIDEGSRILAQYRLTGGLATKAMKVTEADEATVISKDLERKVERLLVSRNGFRDEKSYRWSEAKTVSISEAPWVFEHAWDQLRRASSMNDKTAVTIEFHDGSKVQRLAVARSQTMNSEADVFLLKEGQALGKRNLILGFRGNQLAMFGIEVPLIGLLKFALDER